MIAPRLKSVLPSSLFGRALLILTVPIIVLQLVVGLVFFQRHYMRVTEQLTRGVALELLYTIEQVEAQPSMQDGARLLPEIAQPLELELVLETGEAVSPSVLRGTFDVSGRTVVEELQDSIPRPTSIDLLSDQRTARIGLQTSHGVLRADVPRSRLAVSNPHQLLVLMLLAAFLLTTIAVLFLRNQVKPIRALAEASEDFGKGRSKPFRPAGAEEVRRAGTAFLAMRSRLERQIEQRMQMLSGVSHDLRTPLTRMKLTTALMDDNSEIRELSQDIDQMERMISEFLAFARGDVLEETSLADPVKIAREIVEDGERQGAKIDLRVVGDAANANPVELRASAVGRALQNLVGNALRFGDQVRVTVRLSPRSVEYVVEDDGPGIAPEDRDLAVQPFSRLDTARSHNTGAHSGLGLSIAMDVARSHGGALLMADSEDLGGLKATIRLPR